MSCRAPCHVISWCARGPGLDGLQSWVCVESSVAVCVHDMAMWCVCMIRLSRALRHVFLPRPETLTLMTCHVSHLTSLVSQCPATRHTSHMTCHVLSRFAAVKRVTGVSSRHTANVAHDTWDMTHGTWHMALRHTKQCQTYQIIRSLFWKWGCIEKRSLFQKRTMWVCQ